jgi:hypothetical protein
MHPISGDATFFASADLSLACLPDSNTHRRETLITSGWNRQSGDVSASIPFGQTHPPMVGQAARG